MFEMSDSQQEIMCIVNVLQYMKDSLTINTVWEIKNHQTSVFNMQDNFTVNNVSMKHRAMRHGVLIMLMIIYKRKVCILDRNQKRLLIYYCVYSTAIYIENEGALQGMKT